MADRIEYSDLEKKMKTHNIQKQIEQEVRKREKFWYKNKEDYNQNKRLAELKKVVERICRNDN